MIDGFKMYFKYKWINIQQKYKDPFSWWIRGDKQSFKNIQFSLLLSTISIISTTGLLMYNFIKEGTIKAWDFVEHIYFNYRDRQ